MISIKAERNFVNNLTMLAYSQVPMLFMLFTSAKSFQTELKATFVDYCRQSGGAF